MSRSVASATSVHCPSGTKLQPEAGSQDSIRVQSSKSQKNSERAVIDLSETEQSVILSHAEVGAEVRTVPPIKAVEPTCMTLGTSSTAPKTLTTILPSIPTFFFPDSMSYRTKAKVILPGIEKLIHKPRGPLKITSDPPVFPLPYHLDEKLQSLVKINPNWRFVSDIEFPVCATQLQILTLSGSISGCRIHTDVQRLSEDWLNQLKFRQAVKTDSYMLHMKGVWYSTDCIFCFMRICSSLHCDVRLLNGGVYLIYKPRLVGGGSSRRQNQKKNKGRESSHNDNIPPAGDGQAKKRDFQPQNRKFEGKPYKHTSRTVTVNETKRARVDADLGKAVAAFEGQAVSTSSVVGNGGATSSNYVPPQATLPAPQRKFTRSSSAGSLPVMMPLAVTGPVPAVSGPQAAASPAPAPTNAANPTTGVPVTTVKPPPQAPPLPPAPTPPPAKPVPVPKPHILHKWKCTCKKTCYRQKAFELETPVPVFYQDGTLLIKSEGVCTLFIKEQKQRRTEPKPLFFTKYARTVSAAVRAVPVHQAEHVPLHGERDLWVDAWSMPMSYYMVQHRKSQSHFRNLCDQALAIHAQPMAGACSLCQHPVSRAVLRQIADDVASWQAPLVSDVGKSNVSWVEATPDHTLVNGVAFNSQPLLSPTGAVLAPANTLVTFLPQWRGKIVDTQSAPSFVGYTSRYVPMSDALLKFAAHNARLASFHQPSPVTSLVRFAKKVTSRLVPPAPPIASRTGFILVTNSSGIPIITKQNRLPPILSPPRPPPGSVGVGVKYKFNTQMKKTRIRHLINPELNLRQKLLASGVLGQVRPSLLGLSPGPVAKDPLVSVTVECVSAPVIDMTFNGMGHDDLRTDQSRNATLLHEESLLQWWEYKTYYLGRPLSTARFLADSNAITAVANSKSQRSNMSPETRLTLLCEEAHRAIQNANVPRGLGQNVLTPIQSVSLVLQVKDMNLAETQRRLGVGGSFRLFQ